MKTLCSLVLILLFTHIFDTYNQGYAHLQNIPIGTLVIDKADTTKVQETVPIVTHDTLHHKEWFPFKGFKYELKAHNWSEENKLLFVNILFRESGGTVTNIHQEIDQYLVAICAIRRYKDKNSKLVVTKKYSKRILYRKGSKTYTKYRKRSTKETKTYFYVPKFLGAYTMASKKRPVFTGGTRFINEKAWNKCYETVTDVLSGTIPNYVPYIPHGTYAYLNSRLDVDRGWIRACTIRWGVVASTIKDHHYYCNPEDILEWEYAHIMKNPCNPANKRFKDGFFANKKYKNI